MAESAYFSQPKEILHYDRWLVKNITKKNNSTTTQNCIFYIDTCFVCEQIGYPPQLLRYSAGSNHSPRDFGISADHPAIDNFPHVQIHTQTMQEEWEKEKVYLH